MKALIQRVAEARVTVSGEVIGEIGPGLLILVCAMQGDTDEAPAKLARKIAALRIFRDDERRMNRSLIDTHGAALVVSQFPLAADTSRVNRPGFSAAAPPDEGRRLYEAFAHHIEAEGASVATGRFGADMQVSLVNDGPVTIWMDTDA